MDRFGDVDIMGVDIERGLVWRRGRDCFLMRAMFHSHNRRLYSSWIYATISGKLYSCPFLECSGMGEKEFVDGLK